MHFCEYWIQDLFSKNNRDYEYSGFCNYCGKELNFLKNKFCSYVCKIAYIFRYKAEDYKNRNSLLKSEHALLAIRLCGGRQNKKHQTNLGK